MTELTAVSHLVAVVKTNERTDVNLSRVYVDFLNNQRQLLIAQLYCDIIEIAIEVAYSHSSKLCRKCKLEGARARHRLTLSNISQCRVSTWRNRSRARTHKVRCDNPRDSVSKQQAPFRHVCA
ncbi:hypothetical protein J6590_083945 [Homalodisca vitripennis]|nr:hypothetical protein J6590_083945 [Homalodisca vitripennis]